MARPFHQIVSQISGGEFADEAADAIQAAVRGAHETGKSSKLTLTFDIKAIGANAVSILPTLKLKVSDKQAQPTIFFNNEEGDLSREDPRQHKLPLRTIDAEANMKEAASG